MLEIVIKNMHELKVQPPGSGGTVLDILQENYIDWMHACGMKGRCTTCKFKIVSGSEGLDKPTPSEYRFIRLGHLKVGERLSCQAIFLRGSLEIEAPEAYKLPHMDYSY